MTSTLAGRSGHEGRRSRRSRCCDQQGAFLGIDLVGAYPPHARRRQPSGTAAVGLRHVPRSKAP
jgi:hypothetical protein